MEKKNLVPVDYSNQRVLTYTQVAEGLNCSVDQLRSLYKNHKQEFLPGVHFFNVEGAALRSLKNDMSNRQAVPFVKGAKNVKLWTCQGVARLSKLIDTKEAWNLFSALEKNYFNVVPVENSLFPDEEMVKENPAPVAKKRRAPAETACVYCALMEDQTVKIGYTSDIRDRIKRLPREFGKVAVKHFCSPVVVRNAAQRFEAQLKEQFAACKVEGEFFSVAYEEVVEAIKNLPIEEPPVEVPAPRALTADDKKLLLELCAMLTESPFKEQFVRETANLIVGKKIF